MLVICHTLPRRETLRHCLKMTLIKCKLTLETKYMSLTLATKRAHQDVH